MTGVVLDSREICPDRQAQSFCVLGALGLGNAPAAMLLLLSTTNSAI